MRIRVYDRVRVEPSDESFLDAIAFARELPSTPSSRSAADRSSTLRRRSTSTRTYPPADFLDYVNPPIGKGLPVPGPLKTLIAIPTTAGTGSETTGVSIFDLKKLHAKTGIANRRLKPTLGYLDPDNTRTMPPQVAASTGLDILSHAIESFTAMPFTGRPLPDRPAMRPAYQGSNPISDIWSMQALRMVNQYLVRAFDDPSDDEARANMLLAASYAGVGFGNAGVHLPHGMSYPVSGNVKTYRAPGYVTDHAIVPHGMSVILNAPAVFRFTAPANPARHLAGGGSARGRRVAGEGGGCRPDSRGPDHLVHAAAADAERPEGDRLFFVRHSGPCRRHACRSTASPSFRRGRQGRRSSQPCSKTRWRLVRSQIRFSRSGSSSAKIEM